MIPEQSLRKVRLVLAVVGIVAGAALLGGGGCGGGGGGGGMSGRRVPLSVIAPR